MRDDHPWASQDVVSVKDIVGQPVVLREEGSRTRQLVEEGCAAHDVKLNCTMQLNSREAIVHAVVHGIGVGFVSSVEYADRPGTKAIAFVEQPFTISYYLCCLQTRRNRPMISELFEESAQPPVQ
ncbi:HTH-type transcriptional activator CmpR [compost metagenome]